MSNLVTFEPNSNAIALTFWPKVAHFHHFSMLNQNQWVSNLVMFEQIPRLLPYFLAKNRSFSSLFNVESKSINFIFGHVWGNTMAIALLFGQKSLIFITFQWWIQLNECQIWSFFSKIPRLLPYFLGKNRSFSSLVNVESKSINVKFGHCWAKYQGYSLTLWQQIAHFHDFSMLNHNQSMSHLVICEQNTKAIALLFGQNRSFSSLVNLESKSRQCQI